MKNLPQFFLAIVFLAIIAGLLTPVLLPSVHAQQASQNSASAIPIQADAFAAQRQRQQQNEAQMPVSGDTTTHAAQAFSGSIVKEKGELVLQDSVTKVIYKLDEPAKAKPYAGRQVKVTGKLHADSNTIHVESIELI